MKSFSPRVLAFSVCLLGSVQAQTVYRCGNSYSQIPCANAREVLADDPRSEDQRAEALQAQARNQAVVTDLETARRKDEADALARERLALQAQALAQRKELARQRGSKKKQPSIQHKGRADADKPFTVRVAPPAQKP